MTTEEIRKLLEAGKLVIGHNETVRSLERQEANTVLIASNAPEVERKAVADYAEMAGATVTALEVNNQLLGTVCRKPFAISFIAVRK